MQSAKPRLVLKVDDLERSLSFYRHLFGWSEEWRKDTIAQWRLPSGGSVLFTEENQEEFKKYTDVAFVNPDPGQRFYIMGEKIEDLKRKFEEEQVDFELDVDPGFGQLIMVKDPDGYIVSHWEELYMSDEEILSLYKSGINRIDNVLKGLSNDDLDLVRAEGKWSIRQTVLHFIDSDLTMFHRIKFALAEDGRNYKNNPYDPNLWETGTNYKGRSIETEVSLFKLIREHVLNLCESLPDSLDRKIQTEDQGELTVRKMIKMVAGHAKGHLEQIEETRDIHHV
jgi:catechol 2,3-dioxygenase-like lactoylglutathione lyase family enzyme